MRAAFWLAAISGLVVAPASAQKPAAPCCGIIAIDAAKGVVTAKVTANGNVFQFKVADARTLSTLKVGQGVYANFAGKQVSLDGRAACCAITSGPSASAAAAAPAPPPTPAPTAAPPARSAAGTPARTPAAGAALPAVKSVSFMGRAVVAKGGPAWNATGGQEAVLRVELTAPAPCVERCGSTTVDGQRSGYMPVLVSGNNPGQFNVQRVQVSTGQTVGEVKFVTTPVSASTPVMISAWSEGSAPQQATLTVLPPVMTGFVIDQVNAVGGDVVHATVTFSGPPASAGAVKVVVQTTNSKVLKIPASVTLEPNQTVAAFDIVALGVDQDQTAHVVATYLDKNLPAAVAVRATVLRKVARGRPCCDLYIGIWLTGKPPAPGAVIQLTSANPARVAVPPTVTIPADSDSIIVSADPIPGNSATEVPVTVSYHGVSKRWSVHSEKMAKPDLHVTDVTLTDRFGTAIAAPQDGQSFKMCAVVRKAREEQYVNMPVPPSVLRASYTSPTGTGTSTGRDIDMTITFGSLSTITSCVDLPGLAPGGYHDVTLTADFRNEVDEDRESNNTRNLKITRPPTE